MAIFRPPTDNFVAFVLPQQPEAGLYLNAEQRLANRLGYHLRNAARGRNIYLLDDGSYVDEEPYLFDSVVKIYYGGHDNEVDSDEVASLTAAGYGAYIT